MAKFIDNTTPLNAENLNPLENIPAYSAVYETTIGECKAYRMKTLEGGAVKWSDIPVGALFSVIFNQSTQGTTSDIIGFFFGESTSNTTYLFYGTPDYPVSIYNDTRVRVSNRRYLVANRPYLILKTAASGAMNPLLEIVDQFSTSKLGAALDVEGDAIHLKNLDGTSIRDRKSVV